MQNALRDKRSILKKLFAHLAVAAGLASSLQAGAQDLVVAQVAPFSGPQAVSGLAVRAGVQLYFDAVNARGGVHGRRIRFVSKDDGQNPTQTVRLVHETLDAESPVAFVCTFSTAALQALGTDGVLKERHVSMVGAVSGAQSIIRTPQMLVTKASYLDETDRLFRQIASFGQKRVAVLYQTDAFGQDVLSSAQAAAKKHGVEIVATSGYARNTLAVEPAVAEFTKANPQVVLVGASTAAAIEFVRQYRAVKGTATLYGLSFLDTDQMLAKLGPETVRGFAFSVVLPLTQQTQRSVVREFLELRAASKDKNLSTRSMEGFVAAKTLVKALENTSSPTPAGVTAALKAGRFDLGDFSEDFTESNRAGSTYVDFAMFGSQGRVVQ